MMLPGFGTLESQTARMAEEVSKYTVNSLSVGYIQSMEQPLLMVRINGVHDLRCNWIKYSWIIPIVDAEALATAVASLTGAKFERTRALETDDCVVFRFY